MIQTERKIIYIDASNMTRKEICDVLGIEYVPWYKDIELLCLSFLMLELFCIIAFYKINMVI
mgnify:CR=1 FL=1